MNNTTRPNSAIRKEVTMNRYYARPAHEDPDNSMDVFEQGRLNEFGEPYCVEIAVTPEQAARICREHNAQIAKATGQEVR
jgi:hypothetical protein